MTYLVAIDYNFYLGCYTLCRPGRPNLDLPSTLNPLVHELLRGSHVMHPGHEFWSIALALLNPVMHPFPDANQKQTAIDRDRDVTLTADEQRRAGLNPIGLGCVAGGTTPATHDRPVRALTVGDLMDEGLHFTAQYNPCPTKSDRY
jgi:hypothetical protein